MQAVGADRRSAADRVVGAGSGDESALLAGGERRQLPLRVALLDRWFGEFIEVVLGQWNVHIAVLVVAVGVEVVRERPSDVRHGVVELVGFTRECDPTALENLRGERRGGVRRDESGSSPPPPPQSRTGCSKADWANPGLANFICFFLYEPENRTNFCENQPRTFCVLVKNPSHIQ